MTAREQRMVQVVNGLGVHLRAAGALAQVAGRFQAEVWLENKAGLRANAKSIMSVLSLAAPKGTDLSVTAEGPDAKEAIEAVVRLIQNGFES